MKLQSTKDLNSEIVLEIDPHKVNENNFTKDYVDFLSDAGWRLEKKLPSNNSNYSDLLEDTDWNCSEIDYASSKHYRRDLDALS